MNLPTKTFNKDGKWIEKPLKTTALVCSHCGSKFVKTRRAQKLCIPCIYKDAHVRQ